MNLEQPSLKETLLLCRKAEEGCARKLQEPAGIR